MGDMQTVLIVGAGGVGARVARGWAARGLDAPGLAAPVAPAAKVTAWTLSAASANLLAQEGFTAQACDIRPGASGREWPLPLDRAGYDVVYFCAAPAGGAEAQAVYVDGYARVLKALESCARLPRRLVLAGSTGVIGDQAGAAVDESAPRSDSTPRARTLCACEDQIAAWVRAPERAGAVSAVIVRLVGLYGAERNPLASLKAGTYRYPRDPALGINLIHIADAAAALVRAGQIDLPAGCVEIIHASDGQFPSRREFIEAICDRYELPRPAEPAAAAAASGDGASKASGDGLHRAIGDRRILNEKLRRLLLPELAFPTYREGIASFEMQSP